jgi:hypothetical protein
LAERMKYNKGRGKLEPSDYCMIKYANFQQALLKIPREQIKTLESILPYQEAYEGKMNFCWVYRPNTQTLQIRVYFLDVVNR